MWANVAVRMRIEIVLHSNGTKKYSSVELIQYYTLQFKDRTKFVTISIRLFLYVNPMTLLEVIRKNNKSQSLLVEIWNWVDLQYHAVRSLISIKCSKPIETHSHHPRHKTWPALKKDHIDRFLAAAHVEREGKEIWWKIAEEEWRIKQA